MPTRRVFQATNTYAQGDSIGICTVASLQWAKKTLQLNRGLGALEELGLSAHQMNALMAVWRRYDGNPQLQTEGMGLRMVGTDRLVNQIIDMQRQTNLAAPHICIFWNSHHTMGYRAWTSPLRGRECEFFDMENGLYLADNDTDIRATIMSTFTAGHYDPILGMRVVQL